MNVSLRKLKIGRALAWCWVLAGPWLGNGAGATAQPRRSPDDLYGPLFREVQLSNQFADSKTFVDMLPRAEPAVIVRRYEGWKFSGNFDLNAFLTQYFEPPVRPDAVAFVSDTTQQVADHVRRLWPYLIRPADAVPRFGSLLPLPYPYVVPGGRFTEIYYWDSYFTMLGLRASGQVELMRHMVDNFAYLLDTLGFVPNGNRTYYLSRSQPPFFAPMVRLLRDTDTTLNWVRYRPALEREYDFWMEGTRRLVALMPAHRRVVRMPDGSVLNRYWDDVPRPRPESFREDYTLARATPRDSLQLYRDLRAACESGWDFSSRWLADPADLGSIRTTDIVPVDLNALLLYLEETLALAAAETGDSLRAVQYAAAARRRHAALQTYLWDAEAGIFVDYDRVAEAPTGVASLAMVYPLYFQLATPNQAALVAARLEMDFLRPGGLVTTLRTTGEQWDAPNGWAPLQQLAIAGLQHYGHQALADTVRRRWLGLNARVFRATGRMLEKYDVEDPSRPAGGGEYPLQDGFGWTNGVFLHLTAPRGE